MKRNPLALSIALSLEDYLLSVEGDERLIRVGLLNRELTEHGIPFTLTDEVQAPNEIVPASSMPPIVKNVLANVEVDPRVEGCTLEETPAPPPEPVIEWTPSQAEAWAKLSAWLDLPYHERAKHSRYFVLRGFAGTGKSFMMKRIHTVYNKTRNLDFVAPTHPAVGVLSEYLGFKARTLASRLGVKAVYDEDQISFQLPERPPYITSGTILVIDESSMLSKEYLAFLIRLAEDMNFFILFVGDPAQLPPVGERRSPVWRLVTDKRYVHALIDVKRVDNPNLVDLHVAIRGEIFGKTYTNPLPDYADAVSVVLAPSEGSFLKKLRRDIDRFEAGEAKAVAWRNKQVDYYSEIIRDALGFGSETSVGERLTLSGSFIPFGSLDVEEVGLNAEEVLVEKVEESVVHIHDNYLPGITTDVPVNVLTLVGSSFGTSSVACANTDAQQRKLNSILSTIASQARLAYKDDRRRSSALWEFFWNTKRRFIQPRSAYSATAHSFQGSQTGVVYCDTKDILSNPRKSEAFRCFYVAASRCKERVVSN